MTTTFTYSLVHSGDLTLKDDCQFFQEQTSLIRLLQLCRKVDNVKLLRESKTGVILR